MKMLDWYLFANAGSLMVDFYKQFSETLGFINAGFLYQLWKYHVIINILHR